VLGIRNAATVASPEAGRQVAKRKIVRHPSSVDHSETLIGCHSQLCFFLVRDEDTHRNTIQLHGFSLLGLKDMTVLTSADIPFQQRACNIPTLHFLLPIACRRLIGKNLPPELVAFIVGYMELGMSREEAEQHRRRLMADRMVTGGKSRWDSVSFGYTSLLFECFTSLFFSLRKRTHSRCANIESEIMTATSLYHCLLPIYDGEADGTE
jgi:hypothetical protein